MGYYLRVFCTGPSVPSINTILEAINSTGITLRAEADTPEELASEAWEEAHLYYHDSAQPIPIECSFCTDEDSLASAEVEEFLERLEDRPRSPQRERVVAHLSETRFVVAAQLLSDISDAGLRANDAFLGYLVTHCGGLIQADGEGFYQGADLILPLD